MAAMAGGQSGIDPTQLTSLVTGYMHAILTIVDQSKDVYLFEGIVANGVRGGGIGGTLLRHSMDWARQAGHQTCTLHFAPANSLGAPFWLGHGFVPVEHTMERVIDSRVALAAAAAMSDDRRVHDETPSRHSRLADHDRSGLGRAFDLSDRAARSEGRHGTRHR